MLHVLNWANIRIEIYNKQKYLTIYKGKKYLGRYDFSDIITAKAKIGVFIGSILLDIPILIFLVHKRTGEMFIKKEVAKFKHIDDNKMHIKTIKKSPYHLIWFLGFLIIAIL